MEIFNLKFKLFIYSFFRRFAECTHGMKKSFCVESVFSKRNHLECFEETLYDSNAVRFTARKTTNMKNDNLLNVKHLCASNTVGFYRLLLWTSLKSPPPFSVAISDEVLTKIMLQLFKNLINEKLSHAALKNVYWKLNCHPLLTRNPLLRWGKFCVSSLR